MTLQLLDERMKPWIVKKLCLMVRSLKNKFPVQQEEGVNNFVSMEFKLS